MTPLFPIEKDSNGRDAPAAITDAVFINFLLSDFIIMYFQITANV